MTAKDISFIIPIYNRPDEAKELMESFVCLNGDSNFEIVIVEDGSTITSKDVINDFKDRLNISYFFKENTGPGDSRNYGMRQAKGSYFIILDSDVVLPQEYLTTVLEILNTNYVDCFGGPDAAHSSFSNIQKAINFAMTSFISTGGIRGKNNSVNTFEPRSFNMGISKSAFLATGGFGRIHPGEDPDLSIRLTKIGFKTVLISDAYVYHKRRISWSKFYNQVYKFGSVRPILNQWHPETKKITYWLPTLFVLGFIMAIALCFFKVLLPIKLVGFYFSVTLVMAILLTKNLTVSIYAVFAVLIQFFGYGYGFLKSTLILNFSKKSVESQFPNLFFNIK
jgi:GT2 family glycosyltransferase